jgi:hypothetical protein
LHYYALTNRRRAGRGKLSKFCDEIASLEEDLITRIKIKTQHGEGKESCKSALNQCLQAQLMLQRATEPAGLASPAPAIALEGRWRDVRRPFRLIDKRCKRCRIWNRSSESAPISFGSKAAADMAMPMLQARTTKEAKALGLKD